VDVETEVALVRAGGKVLGVRVAEGRVNEGFLDLPGLGLPRPEVEPDGWYAGGVIRPGAPGTVLEALISDLPAQVTVVTETADGDGVVRVRTPERDARTAVRYGSPAEGRRRTVLAALDLLRRTVRGEGSDPA